MQALPATVAGRFYNADPDQLKAELAELFPDSPRTEKDACAIIAPHAGYMYSARIAARAYSCLPLVKSSCALILGPAHRHRLKGLAIPESNALQTPLGQINLIQRDAVSSLPFVETSNAPFKGEHSVEVHLPFIQYLAPGLPILPALVGAASPQEVCKFLSALDNAAIIISSDLSHFHPEAQGKALDRQTTARILALEALPDPALACGAYGINGLLHLARQKGWQARCLALGNSRAASGDVSSVVGYGAYAFFAV